MTDFSLVNSSNFRSSSYSRNLRKINQQCRFVFRLNTMCFAWRAKLIESAKAKNQPETHLQSICLFPFDLQILSIVDDCLKKDVIQNSIPARAEPHFCRWFIKFETPNVTLCSLFTSRWVFKQLYDKGLVYRGVKVMPFSTACNTPLSNFESHQNYKVNTLYVAIRFTLLSSVWIWKALGIIFFFVCGGT